MGREEAVDNFSGLWSFDIGQDRSIHGHVCKQKEDVPLALALWPWRERTQRQGLTVKDYRYRGSLYAGPSAQPLGDIFIEGLQRPIGMTVAWDKEAARVPRAL